MKRNRKDEPKPVGTGVASIGPVDMCVPVYLNQQIVYDLLAIVDDGFSQLSTIKTSTADTHEERTSTSASIGVSNAFAFLGVSFGKEGASGRGIKRQTDVATERIHTPTSLFARLRLMLKAKNLLHSITSEEEFNSLSSADFVEFKAVLRKNPLLDLVECMLQVFELDRLFSGHGVAGIQHKGGKSGDSGHAQDFRSFETTLRQMQKSLGETDTVELLGDVLQVPGLRAVLSVHARFLGNTILADILDGDFHVLGKCTRIVPDASGGVNLLRKTSFGRLQPTVFETMAQSLPAQDIIRLPQLLTVVKGPAIQVIPIAIFV
jgi:hypothetical protein